MAKSKKSKSTLREVELLAALRRLGGAARNASLAELLEVSEETVRRTVKALAKADQVKRVHGGAYLSGSEASAGIFHRMGQRKAEKTRIAQAAAGLVTDGTTVFLGTGSTPAYVAEALRERANLTIVTNSLNAAQALANSQSNRIFLAGGELNQSQSGLFGPEALDLIATFNIDTAFLSVDSVDKDAGFLVTHSGEAFLSRAVSKRARRTIIVADHAKFGLHAPIVACPANDVDLLISDQSGDAAFARAFADWGVAVITAEADEKPRKKNRAAQNPVPDQTTRPATETKK